MEVKTPYDYLTTNVNETSLAEAWRQGRQVGIKEVVDSVDLIFKLPHITTENARALWQAQKEEWGLKED